MALCGIAGFLLVLDPRPPPGPGVPTGTAVAVVVGGCAAVSTVALAWSARRRGPARALGLAVVTGCAYGLTAVLLDLVAGQLRLGWDEPLRHAALYAICLLGPAAVVLSQNALQHGRRAAPGVAIVLLVDPAVALLCGVLWFGERIVATPVAVVVASACVAVTIAGIALAQAGPVHRPPCRVTAPSVRPRAAEPPAPRR
jgi:hypothetical protein